MKIIHWLSFPAHWAGEKIAGAMSARFRLCLRNHPFLKRLLFSRKTYSCIIGLIVTQVGWFLFSHHVCHELIADGVTAFGLSPLCRIVADVLRVEI
jgi:hypothetical protein